MLHDPNKSVYFLSQGMAKTLPGDTRSSAEQQLFSMLESGAALPEAAQSMILQTTADEKKLLSLFKFQARLSSTMRKQLLGRVNSTCAQGASAPICKWTKWPYMNERIAAFEKEMGLTAPKMQGIDPAAQKMAGLLDATKAYEGSGEPQVDILVALGNSQIYEAFGNFSSARPARTKRWRKSSRPRRMKASRPRRRATTNAAAFFNRPISQSRSSVAFASRAVSPPWIPLSKTAANCDSHRPARILKMRMSSTRKNLSL